MAVAYDFDECATFLRANGAKDDIENFDGHPAWKGIEGDKDPSDPMNMLDQCKSTEGALAALDALLAKVSLGGDELPDKGEVAMMGMQVKKGNKELEKAMWTPECQAKFTEVCKAL